MAEHPTGDRVRREAIPEEPRKHGDSVERLEALRPEAHTLALRLGLQRPVAFIDLETTGLDTDEAHIVQLATLKLSPGGKTILHSRMVNPGMPIPPGAVAVHGITDENVAGCPRFGEIAPGVAAFLAGCDLAGYNIAAYDVPLLEAEFRRAGVEFSLEGRRIVDAMRIFHSREPRNLEGAVRFYCGGRDIKDAHSAEADTLSTLEILAEQLDRYRDLPADIDELDRISRPPAWFDRDGRLVWRDGELCFGFGKHRGRLLSEVAEEAPGYLEWILRDDFSLKVKDAITMAKAGSPPRQLATPANEPGRP